MKSDSTIRIATRASRLAMWQAQHVLELLNAAAPDHRVEIVPLSTIGDRDKSEALTQLGGSGGTGVFTREIQAAILDGRADIAVHSLKDLPTSPVDGLTLGAVPARGAMFDVLVLPNKKGVRNQIKDNYPETVPDTFYLPQNARVGTGSPRRKAQLLHLRPDLQFAEARGNVETRLRKLDEGQFDALVLAEAGLTRLEYAGRISAVLQPPVLLPAVGQGALGIECRTGDADLRAILERLTDRTTLFAVLAERTVLSTLRAGCHAPLGVWTRADGDATRLTAVVLSLEGTQRVESERRLAVENADDAVALGAAVAADLLNQGAMRLMGQVE